MKLWKTAAGAALALTVGAGAASADTLLTANGGLAFGGDLRAEDCSTIDLGCDSETHGTYGVALTVLGDGPLGFEVDASYSPNFYGQDSGVETSLGTVMGNVLLGGGMGDAGKIYATAGLGIVRSQVNDVDDFFDVSSNDFGVNGGVGIIGNIGDSFAVRADLRYFRTLADDEPDNEFDVSFGGLDFWRGTVGVGFRF